MKRAAAAIVVTMVVGAGWVGWAGCVATTAPPPAAPGPGPGPGDVPVARESAPAAPAGEREEPIDCSGDDIVAIRDCVIEAEVAIDAHGNCRVQLDNCEIRGSKVAINAHGNAQVVISGGSVSGAKAVDAHGNARVTIDGAAVSGVIDQHGNAQVVAP
jgi:hypothetical protein